MFKQEIIWPNLFNLISYNIHVVQLLTYYNVIPFALYIFAPIVVY